MNKYFTSNIILCCYINLSVSEKGYCPPFLQYFSGGGGGGSVVSNLLRITFSSIPLEEVLHFCDVVLKELRHGLRILKSLA